MSEANGPSLNLYGMGTALEDAETPKQVGKGTRTKVRLVEFPGASSGESKWRREPITVELNLKAGDTVPKQGDTILINSGVFSIQKNRDGDQYYPIVLAFSWRIVTGAKAISSKTEPEATAPAIVKSTPVPDPNEVPSIPGSDDEIPV
jgi:hypothetical protein